MSLALLVGCASLFAQQQSELIPLLPVPLYDVEVTLERRHGGGCPYVPCTHYTVTIRGDGTVSYSGAAGFAPPTPPVVGTRTRRISPDEVVALVNQFLRARFFDALGIYSYTSSIEREGDTVVWRGSGGADLLQADLTLRIGERKKTVTLETNYPVELARLTELIDRIGGPEVWLNRAQ